MKTVLFISDTHGNLEALNLLRGIMSECDYIVHAGDYWHDLRGLSEEFADKIYQVKGNCDGGGEDLIFEAEGIKILITHGDRYGVKGSLYKLMLKAKEIGANLVLYGHTHVADVTEIDGITLINPGAMTMFNKRSYCYVVIHKKKITAKIVEF